MSTQAPDATSFRNGPTGSPAPVRLPRDLEVPVLACGTELKNTVCLARGRRAFVSHHIGDLENPAAMASFLQAIDHYSRLFDIQPRRIAYDLHPEYRSTRWAKEQRDVEIQGVQHHHAHIASCLADNLHVGPVIGVAFDGLGFGTDGTFWGGEFLVADLSRFERIGSLARVAMPGGSAAIREPWRMAAVYVEAAFGRNLPALSVRERHADRWDGVLHLARSGGTTAPRTSSAGRLFDAVSALLGVCDAVTYEGQAAIELEQAADPAETGAYAASAIEGEDGRFEIRGAELVRRAAEDLRLGEDVPRIAARFHNGVAHTIRLGARLVRTRSGLNTVALSGGVFQNALLLERAGALLAEDGFEVLRHREVPPNGGGVSLGQAVIAGSPAERNPLTPLLRPVETPQP